MLTYSKTHTHRHVFHNVRQSFPLKNTGAPPPTSNARATNAPPRVCPFVAQGSQVHPRAADSAQARVCKRSVYDKGALKSRMFSSSV